MKHNKFCLFGIIVAAAFVLVACSDDTPPQSSTMDESDSQTERADLFPLPLDAPNGFTDNGETFGIGPAFSGQRPPSTSLGTTTEYETSFTIHSGEWRGTGDGSTGSGDIITF